MKTKAFSREERRAQIVKWFAIRVQKGNENYATMNEIARGLGMSPSNHLLRILKDMYTEKILMQKESFKPGRWHGHAFMLYPGTYERPRGRSINLNVSGRNVGQMELF